MRRRSEKVVYLPPASWLAGLLVCALSALAQAEETPPVFIQAAQALHCASTQEQAAAALQEMERHTTADMELPYDVFHDRNNNALYLASLDIVLRSLDEAAARFPQLTPEINRLFAGWNYCGVLQDGAMFDIETRYGRLEKRTPATTFPAGQLGLAQWGFPAPVAPERASATAIASPEQLRRQCIPVRSQDGDLVNPHLLPLSGSLRQATASAPGKTTAYPYQWRPACEVDLGSSDGYSQGYLSGLEAGLGRRDAALEANVAGRENLISPEQRLAIKQRFWSPASYEAGLAEGRQAGYRDGLTAAYQAEPATVVSKRSPQELQQLAIVPDMQSGPPASLAGAIPSAGSSPSIASVPIDSENKKFSGNYYTAYRSGSNIPSYGGVALWAPKPNWFVRLGADVQYRNDSGDKFNYSWGFGYYDWRPGTWSLQVNNWGPIQTGQALAEERAVASLSYNFRSELLEQKRISSFAALISPFSQDAPSMRLGMQWTPVAPWYVYTAIDIPVNGDNATWSYAFGRRDWRPFTFSIQYNNYEKNRLDQLNFKENGTWLIGGNWAF
ncbi:hypothetical protein [Methylobacillus flagellatus]|uniref:hypothetical protein n=1 Tax=Methylobacillus flagellatus TaxID=405 RepID=UPI0010F7DEE1|nr:hypothetical protein [Methylobacillus flagellatus]